MHRNRVLLIALLIAPGCSAATTPDGAVVSEPADSNLILTDATNELYADFIDCDPLPEPGPDPAPEEMVVPEGMVIVDVAETGPLISATGFIDATPIDLRDLYANDPLVDLIHLEDEGFEAEILIDTGEWRTFLKASVRCRTGSVVALLLGPDDQPDSLPVPGQLQSGGQGQR